MGSPSAFSDFLAAKRGGVFSRHADLFKGHHAGCNASHLNPHPKNLRNEPPQNARDIGLSGLLRKTPPLPGFASVLHAGDVQNDDIVLSARL